MINFGEISYPLSKERQIKQSFILKEILNLFENLELTPFKELLSQLKSRGFLLRYTINKKSTTLYINSDYGEKVLLFGDFSKSEEDFTFSSYLHFISRHQSFDYDVLARYKLSEYSVSLDYFFCLVKVDGIDEKIAYGKCVIDKEDYYPTVIF